MSVVNLFSSKSFPLSNLLTQIENGDIALPDLQRPFVWNSTKIRDLLDSLYSGYPVGFVLLWEIGSNEHIKKIGTDEKSHDPRFLVIDGQQRLTSLFSIFKDVEIVNDKFEKFKPQIAFHPLRGKFAVTDAAIRNDVSWVSDISAFFGGDSTHSFINTYLETVKERKEINEEGERIIISNLEKLSQIKSYPFTVLELSPSLDTEEVSDIFIRVNSKGQRLKQSDFVMTVLSVYLPELREKIERFASDTKKPPQNNEPSPYNSVLVPGTDHLVRVLVADAFSRGRLKYAHPLLKGRDLETEKESREVREQNLRLAQKSSDDVFDLTNWHGFIKILKNIGIVNKSLISSSLTVYFTYALYLHARRLGLNLQDLEQFVSSWMYMSILTSRYIGSPETIFERDIILLRKEATGSYFTETYQKVLRSNLTDDFWNTNLPAEISVSSSTRNPGYLAYLMVLNMNNIKVLFSEARIRDILGGDEAYKKNLIERHHIFPVNYLRKKGIKNISDINQVANYCYIEYPLNIEISDQSPSEYFPPLLEKWQYDKKEWIYHSLPEKFWEIDYRSFLEARRLLMASVIKDNIMKFID